MTGIVPHVARATPDDLEALVTTFATAFADDPMVRWPLPGAGPDDVAAYFRAILGPYVDRGVLWALDGNAGGAAWLPPEVVERFAEIDEGTRVAVDRLTADGGRRYRAFWDWLDSHLPAQPCWYLDVLAVRPDRQGAGLGRALLRHGLALARVDGRPAFLETAIARNVGLYESVGFEVVGEEAAPDGGPLIWFMQTRA